MSTELTAQRDARQLGPPLLVPATVFAVLTVTAVILASSFPRPTASAAAVLAYDHDHAAMLRLSAFFLFASSVPLLVWTATVYRRLRGFGVTAPGAAIALAGGLLAAGFLSLSGLLGWVAARAGDLGSPALARTLADLMFMTGGPGYVVPFGLLIAGVAVPSLFLGILPRSLAWAGLFVAVVAVLSAFVLLTLDLGPALPVGRFGGLVWLVAASALIPRTRSQVATAPAS